MNAVGHATAHRALAKPRASFDLCGTPPHASAAVTLDVRCSDLFDGDLDAAAAALNDAALRSGVGKLWQRAPTSPLRLTAETKKPPDDRGFQLVTPAGFE